MNHHHQAVVYHQINSDFYILKTLCLDNDHEGGNGSMDDDDDDASASDRSSRAGSSVKQTTGIRWDYRVNFSKIFAIFF